MVGAEKASIVVGPRAVFTSDSSRDLEVFLESEADFWSAVFPRGIQSRLTGSLLQPNYSSLIDLVGTHQFRHGPLQLLGRGDVAIYPASSSAEGKALLRFADTDFAFAILRYLWTEAKWTSGSAVRDPSDKTAEGIGEPIVLAFRINSAVDAQPS